jgi:hypothetical protein
VRPATDQRSGAGFCFGQRKVRNEVTQVKRYSLAMLLMTSALVATVAQAFAQFGRLSDPDQRSFLRKTRRKHRSRQFKRDGAVISVAPWPTAKNKAVLSSIVIAKAAHDIPSYEKEICRDKGRGLTLLIATALAGALAIPFVFLLLLVLSVHYFFFSVTFAVYLFVSWLGGVAVAILIAAVLLRRGAPNDASHRFVDS